MLDNDRDLLFGDLDLDNNKSERGEVLRDEGVKDTPLLFSNRPLNSGGGDGVRHFSIRK